MRRLLTASVLGAIARGVRTLDLPTVFGSRVADDRDAVCNGDDVRRHGMWFVPTGEVLPQQEMVASASSGRTSTTARVSRTSRQFPATFGVGVGDRAEVFGSWALVTRIDRDTAPAVLHERARIDGHGHRRRPARQLSARPRRRGRQPARRFLAGRASSISSRRPPTRPADRRRRARHGEAARRAATDRTARRAARPTSPSTRSCLKQNDAVVEFSGYGGPDGPRQSRRATS